MKRVALIVGLVGCSIAAQAQWCFSQFNNCNQTPAVMFNRDSNSNARIANLLRPAQAVAHYTQVLPMRFSPITREFFLYAKPTGLLENRPTVPLLVSPRATVPSASSGPKPNTPAKSTSVTGTAAGSVLVPYSPGR